LLPYFKAITMLAKITSKNQLTLPKSIVQSVGKADYFEVEVENGRVILTPVRIQKADAVRAKLEALGIDEQDVADAIAWARAK
ncbi:AbrB/MazE/SpoVT family DNA-binding domain-containing protein, partial [Methyloglobulus sp.]|uniref:AbrB/MazE/SpoVT family DNA-binding domain-containing protein n=1 Tax=Methyloglobulus sp. TaxID=2518622 RepID=UPI0032B769FD